MSGWHRKLHIFHIPFYYIEYGMAQVGALQVWRNALRDQARPWPPIAGAAIGRNALSAAAILGRRREFRFDEPMLKELVSLIEDTVAQLERAN
jgi:oligoendopeptidase F